MISYFTRSTRATSARSSKSTRGCRHKSGVQSGRRSRAQDVREHAVTVLRVVVATDALIFPVFAGVLGGVVLFKKDFTQQFNESLTFLPL